MSSGAAASCRPDPGRGACPWRQSPWRAARRGSFSAERRPCPAPSSSWPGTS